MRYYQTPTGRLIPEWSVDQTPSDYKLVEVPLVLEIKPTLEDVIRQSGGFHPTDSGIQAVAAAIRKAYPEAGL